MNASVISPPNWQAVTADQATASENALPTFQTPGRDAVRGAVRDACLVSIYPTGPLMGTRYPLAGNAVVIGRSPDSAICNDDSSVSRSHALLTRGDDTPASPIWEH